MYSSEPELSQCPLGEHQEGVCVEVRHSSTADS